MTRTTALILVFLAFADCTTAKVCTDDVCHYTMVVRRQRSMTYTNKKTGATYNVAVNGTSLQIVENTLHKALDEPLIGHFVDPKDVVTVTGESRNVILINDQFPGPTLEIMEGSEVVVTVVNHLLADSLTVHWHGLHQTHNVWMDGVPYITMCPIASGQSFVYRFIAAPKGTHWYHAHTHTHRSDGMYGALLIHERLPTSPYHIALLSDLMVFDGPTSAIMNHYDMFYRGTGELSLHYQLGRHYSVDGVELTAVRYHATLINGRGRLNRSVTALPIEVFDVNSSLLTKFHVMHAGLEYSFQISVDEHQLNVVASDGHDLQDRKVDYILLHPGESMDFELLTTAMPRKSSYWLRVETMTSSPEELPLQTGYAIVRYNASNSKEPSTSRRQCSQTSPCGAYNCPFRGYPGSHYITCYNFDEARSSYSRHHYNQWYGLDTPYDHVDERFLNWAFPIGSSVNARKFSYPTGPLFGTNVEQYVKRCDETACRRGCLCTHTVVLTLNTTVQFVLTNYQPNSRYIGHHSVHIHGYAFAVLKVGYPLFNTSTGQREIDNPDVECDTHDLCVNPRWRNGPPTMNFIDPPVKDTVLVPAGGYVVVRLVANNPGHWLFHCHQETHFMEGMSVLIDVGPGQHPPLPDGFPICGQFNWTDKGFENYMRGRRVTEAEPPTQKPTTTSPTFGLTNDHELKVREGRVILTSDELIGALAGFALLGAVLVLVSMGVVKCGKKHST